MLQEHLLHHKLRGSRSKIQYSEIWLIPLRKSSEVCKHSRTVPILISKRFSCYTLLLSYYTTSNSQLHSSVNIKLLCVK